MQAGGDTTLADVRMLPSLLGLYQSVMGQSEQQQFPRTLQWLQSHAQTPQAAKVLGAQAPL